MMYIYPYKPASKGAKRLAETMHVRRIRHRGSNFTGRGGPKVVNWGATSLPDWHEACEMINTELNVEAAADKRKFFDAMHGTNLTPKYFVYKNDALQYIRDGGTIVCRTILKGHSGRGIVIARSPEHLVDAPLYVQYKKKRDEYRVHVMKDEVIDVQRKARRLEVTEPNWEVRNHANGFIYAREDVDPGPQVLDAAIRTIDEMDLDFGAVDIIVNAHEQRAYVLEVNTAPGLEGQTIQSYAEAFKRLYGE